MLDKSKADDEFPWVAQYPRDVPAKLESSPPVSMPELLDRSAKEFGASIALSQGDQRWTYTEMQALVARAARGLQALGVRNGDRVAVMMPNHAAVPIWFFGALSIGAALVSINALFPSGQVEHMLADSGARVMLTLDSPETIGKAMPLLEKGLLDRIVTASMGGSELSDIQAGSAADVNRGVVSLQALLNNDGRYDRPSLDPARSAGGAAVYGRHDRNTEGRDADARQSDHQRAPDPDVVSFSRGRIGTPADSSAVLAYHRNYGLHDVCRGAGRRTDGGAAFCTGRSACLAAPAQADVFRRGSDHFHCTVDDQQP